MDNQNSKFNVNEGELNIIKPSCKSCKRSLITTNGLECAIYKNIPLDVKLNKVKCSEFEKK